MELISKAGHHMSLAALQQNDPYINKIVDVTGQVALYTFNSKANEWEKTDIEGTLFVYTRSASPYHGFTIMNRLNMENLVEPINKDLEFQLQDPFLLYRNSNLAIYSIWFYDKKDCQRIAQLMTRVVKQEAFQAGQALPNRSTPSRTNGCVEGRPIDILELLSKAKEEYQRSIIGESDVSPNTEYGQNLELLKAVPDGKERATTVPQHEKKQITVEELFGSSLPKEPTLLGIPKESSKEKGQPEHFLRGQDFIPSFPFEPPLVSHLNVDPGGDHTGAANVPKNNQHLGPSPVPLPAVKYNLRPSPVFQPGVPGEGHVQPTSPLHLGQPVPEKAAPAAQTMRGLPGAASYLPLEVLSQLKPDALPAAGFSKPSLAPNFLPAQLATPECFIEPILKPPSFGNAVAAPIQSLKAGPAVPEEGPSILLSPSVFQHSVAKTPEPAPPSPSSSLMVTEPPTTISRHQLQETLIHLIKNDSRFLSTIHEAYLQSLTKDLNNVKL